jgi:hypothetical protein
VIQNNYTNKSIMSKIWFVYTRKQIVYVGIIIIRVVIQIWAKILTRETFQEEMDVGKLWVLCGYCGKGVG